MYYYKGFATYLAIYEASKTPFPRKKRQGQRSHSHLEANLSIKEFSLYCNPIWLIYFLCVSEEQSTGMRPCGLMDKAPDFGTGDCRFESCRGQSFCGKNAYVLKSLFPIILGTWSDSLRQKQIPLWYFILSQNRKHVLQHILQHMRHLQFLMRNSISKKEETFSLPSGGRLMHLRIFVVLQL